MITINTFLSIFDILLRFVAYTTQRLVLFTLLTLLKIK